MRDPSSAWLVPHPLWDLVLRLAPAHLFVFDTELVCRYAAPAGDAFLGLAREQLTGRHAVEVLPPAANGLRPMLEQVLQDGTPWSTPHYRYSHRLDDGEALYVWAVHIEPVRLDPYRGALLALSDVVDLVDQRDRLQLRADALQEQVDHLSRLATERDRLLGAATDHLRTLLTPAWGYLQFLTRHPELWRDAPTSPEMERLVLAQLRAIRETIETLEQSAGPMQPSGQGEQSLP